MVSRWHSATNLRRQIRACVLLVLFASAGVLLIVSGASAQAYWQPQPAPAITADHETWIYVTYQGSRWRASGKAVRMAEAAFQRIGQLGAFPVYAKRGSAENPRIVYVPSRSGWLARYERAGQRPRY